LAINLWPICIIPSSYIFCLIKACGKEIKGKGEPKMVSK
jgi:hypothetical protein